MREASDFSVELLIYRVASDGQTVERVIAAFLVQEQEVVTWAISTGGFQNTVVRELLKEIDDAGIGGHLAQFRTDILVHCDNSIALTNQVRFPASDFKSALSRFEAQCLDAFGDDPFKSFVREGAAL